MSDPVCARTLLEELDARQDEVLSLLGDLEQQCEQLLAECLRLRGSDAAAA